MSAPNPQLVAALDASRVIQSNPQKEWNGQIEFLSSEIHHDSFENRSNSYNRQPFTVAALLASDNRLRSLVVDAGISLRAFDDLILRAQSIIQQQVTRPDPAVKIANVLNKVSMNY